MASTCLPPDRGFLLASGTVLPSNASALPWWGNFPARETGSYALPSTSWFRIEKLEKNGLRSLPVAVSWLESELTSLETDSRLDGLVLVGPESGMEPGASYVFTYIPPKTINLGWSGPSLEQIIEVTVSCESISWPVRDVGKLRLFEQKLGVLETLTLQGGMGSTSFTAAQVVVELELPRALERWRKVLSFSVLVNGKLWRPSPHLCLPTPPGKTWEGEGKTRLFANCSLPNERVHSPFSKLTDGFHTVKMVAWLPGVEGRFEAVERIQLECEEDSQRQP